MATLDELLVNVKNAGDRIDSLASIVEHQEDLVSQIMRRLDGLDARLSGALLVPESVVNKVFTWQFGVFGLLALAVLQGANIAEVAGLLPIQ